MPRPPKPLQEDPNPLSLTIRSLGCWPDDELYSLARALESEIRRRRAAAPIALPLALVMADLGAVPAGF